MHTKKIAMRQDCKGLSTAEIIDLYKFYYSTADGVSNKRMQANNYFFGFKTVMMSDGFNELASFLISSLVA